MAQSTSPFVLNNVSLTLKVAAGTAQEFQCQLNRAELVPSANTGAAQTYETFCDTHSSGGGGNATWTLELSGFQAYADTTDLSLFLFANEGSLIDYVLTPMGGTISATNPAFSGQVTGLPMNIGGTANQYAQGTVSLPCTAKPTMLTSPPVAFAGVLTGGNGGNGDDGDGEADL